MVRESVMKIRNFHLMAATCLAPDPWTRRSTHPGKIFEVSAE